MSNDYASKLSDQEKTALRLVHAAKYEGFSYRVDDADEFKDAERFWASIPVFFVHAALRAFGYHLDSSDPIARLVKLGLLRYKAQGHNPFGLGDKTWRVTDDVHLDAVVSSERHGSETLEVATMRCGNKEVGSFKAPYGETSAPSVTLTADGLVAYAEIGAGKSIKEKPPTDASSTADTPRTTVAAATPDPADPGEPREHPAGGDDSVEDLRLGATAHNDRQLTVTQAARITGLNTGIISRSVARGDIASNGKKGRARRISLASAEEFADAYRKKQQIRDGAKSEFIRESTARVEAAFRRNTSSK